MVEDKQKMSYNVLSEIQAASTRPTCTIAFSFVCLLIGCCTALRAVEAVGAAGVQEPQGDVYGTPKVWRVIEIPQALLSDDGHAGDLRIGDIDGDGAADFVIFRSTGGNMKPCFIGAFDAKGQVLWKHGVGGGQPLRPGPVTVYDFDADGSAEVLCFFADPAIDAEPTSMKNVVLQIRDGHDGQVTRQATCPALQECRGAGPNWCHQRLLVANFQGTTRPRDFLVKLGAKILAFDEHLSLLWTYDIKWNEYSRCSAYIPAVGDIDGDGKDEVNGGFYLLDEDGRPLWEGRIAVHMDSVAIVPWDDGNMRAICSGYGHVLGSEGEIVLRLGADLVPHGQEVRVADFDVNCPGPEMIIRYRGHNPDVIVVANDGTVRHRFALNDSPNHTGMEAIYWNGEGRNVLLYNGGMLWHANGRLLAALPGLPEPVGPVKMGWYHCIAADVCGDQREEAILYNPWGRRVWIFTAAPLRPGAYLRYEAGPRQYNPRLMD